MSMYETQVVAWRGVGVPFSVCLRASLFVCPAVCLSSSRSPWFPAKKICHYVC